MSTPSVGVSPRRSPRVALSRLLRARETSIVFVLVVVIALTTIKSPTFIFSEDGWRDLLLSPSILMILAVGQAIVIISRNVDVSVGSILGFSAYLSGRILTDHPNIPIVVVFVVGTLAGTVMGLINGSLVALLRIPALVITLGTLYIYRGVTVLWAGGTRIFPADLPPDFTNLGIDGVLSIPLLTLIAIAVTVFAAWFMYSTRGGRSIYAIGSDPVAAKLYGLRVEPGVIFSMTLSGALAGFAGVLYLARYATADSQAGVGWELQAIAAVVIGGVAILGGSGTVWGAAIGAVLLVTLNRALPVLGIQDFWQQFVIGALIIFAIVTDRIIYLRQTRKLLTIRGSDNE